MKKLIFITSALAFFLFACSKQDNLANSNTINKQLLTEVTKMKNGSSRVLAYGSLNYNEKYIIWKEHLAGWIESGKLTKEQQNVISELLSVIKPEMWIDNSSKAKTLNSDNVAIIQYKIKQLFTKSLGGRGFCFC